MKRPPLVALSAVVAALAGSHSLPALQGSPPARPMERRPIPPPPTTIGDRADIEMDTSQGIPIVSVMVNGRGPYRFGIDSGAQGDARLSARLATELGLMPVGEVMTGDPSGNNRTTLPVYRVDTLALGELIFTGVSTEQLALADAVDGILALGLFRQWLLTIDYADGRLIVARGALPTADGTTVLDYIPGPGGAVQVPMQIGDVETVVNLDTGAARVGLALPPRKLAQVATRGEPRVIGRARTISQDFDVSSVDLAATVKVGALVLPITVVTFPSPDPVGVIGSAALRTIAITIDQQHRRVRMVATGA
jgi:hypothetical protein